MSAESAGGVRWLSEPELRAWRSLQMMQMRLDRQLARQLAVESDLSYPDYLVLVVLTERPDDRARMNEIGDQLGWEKSRTSHHVTRMAKRGLVRKERCDEDRRGAFVIATPSGRAAIEAAAPRHVETVRQLFVDLLTPEQLAAVADISEMVLANLDHSAS